MTALYSLRTDGDQYRITKFVDGDVESSYLCTDRECECHAGHRHTCRHRQMLPTMIAHGLVNTHWLFAYDAGGTIVDINDTPKRLLDELAASRTQEETEQDTLPVPAGQHSEPDAYGIGPMMHELPRLKADNERKRRELTSTAKPSWRRL